MTFFLELLPLIALAGGYVIGKQINPEEAMFYLAYGAILGTILQFVIYKFRKEKMQKMTLITGVILILFSAMSIILHDKIFIYSKPTVISFLFAIGFYIYHKIKHKTVIESMVGEQFELSAEKWVTLNWAWITFNVLVGIANLIIVLQIRAEKMNPDIWVLFKFPILPIITLVFVIGQTVYLLKNGKAIEQEDQLK